MTKLNPYLNFDGNTEEAFNFYKSVFGGEFGGVHRFKEMPMEGVTLAPQDAERIMHIALPIGKESVLMASDTCPSLGQTWVQGNSVHLSIHPESRDEADRIFTALSAGGRVEMPIADQPWGGYFGSFADKFGVQWMVHYAPPCGPGGES